MLSQMSPTRDANVAVEDVVWARPDDVELVARIYRPLVATRRAPVLIDVHGGAWNVGDRTAGALHATALACNGQLVVAIDFRMAPHFKHPAASADVAASVRWVRLNADRLDADPQRIGLIGHSSGGHLSMLAGIKPNAPMHRGTRIVDSQGTAVQHDDIDASVAYVIGLWPVSDPAARFRYATNAGIVRLQQATNNYFVDEAAQWDASIQRIVTAGEAEQLPPLLIVQAGADSNIPQDMTFDLLRAYQARGGSIEYVFYPAMPHGFGHRPSTATDDMVLLGGDFIRRKLG
jgi:acetyl esterase